MALFDKLTFKRAERTLSLLRENLRNQIMRDMVFEREVDARIYWGVSSKEIKEYYGKNKDKFTKPETVTISEIFVTFAGRDEKAVREKAKGIVAQLRSGADFEKLCLEKEKLCKKRKEICGIY